MRWAQVCCGLLIGAVACSVPPEPLPDRSAVPPFQNVSDAVAYVGDAACASCHEDLYRGYQTHGMARSFSELRPDKLPTVFAETIRFHQETDFFYRVYEEGGRYYQEEYRLGREGDVMHRLVREMEFVAGSGNAAHIYFTEQNGRYYELPLTWYPHPEKWDFSPGFAANNKRFDRVLNNRCAFCHASYPEPVAFTNRKYEAPLQPIGCERCHGPGALHVDERLAFPEAADSVDYTIVNPRHLPLDRRLDVCQQCHLNGTVTVLREGREPYAFRPSMYVDEHVALFNKVEAESGFIGIDAHAERMQASACFIESIATLKPMDCVTCHNPHEGFREQGPAYFNQTCQTCHAPQDLQRDLPLRAKVDHSPEANCIACHMPRVGSSDEPHTSFTDHKIRVVHDSVAVALSDGPKAKTVLEPLFARDRQGAEGQLYQGLAYMSYGRSYGDLGAINTGVALTKKVINAFPTYDDARVQLGQSLLVLGAQREAVQYLEEAVAIAPSDPRRLQALAQGLQWEARTIERIDTLYQRAIRLQPQVASLHVEYGNILNLQGRPQDAYALFNTALAEEAWLPEAHQGLGFVLLQQRQYAAAEAAFREALALNPDYPDALVNLGITLVAMRRGAEAIGLYERALAINAQHVAALYNLGIYHLQQSQLAQSIGLLERAIAIQPTYSDAQLNLAWAYLLNQNYAEAERMAERVLERMPDNARAQQIRTSAAQSQR